MNKAIRAIQCLCPRCEGDLVGLQWPLGTEVLWCPDCDGNPVLGPVVDGALHPDFRIDATGQPRPLGG